MRIGVEREMNGNILFDEPSLDLGKQNCGKGKMSMLSIPINDIFTLIV